MIFKCPRCGKEYCISNVRDKQMILRCVDHNCRHIFTVAEADVVTADDSARIEEEKTAKPAPAATDMEQFVNDHADVAKSLAQDYFNDLPGESAEETETQAASAEDQGDGTLEEQRQRLFELAQEGPDEEQKEDMQDPELKPFAARRTHEKRGQRIGCHLLMFLALLLFAGRILLTRLWGTELMFKYLQPQIIPSGLYFCVVIVLIVHMLRYTAKPKWFSAVLVLLPLILDAWYLLPDAPDIMPADTWYTVNCSVKIAFSLFGLLRSIRAGKHPVRKRLSAS